MDSAYGRCTSSTRQATLRCSSLRSMRCAVLTAHIGLPEGGRRRGIAEADRARAGARTSTSCLPTSVGECFSSLLP